MSQFLKYRPEIDGLRAFAIIPVVLFHLGVAHVPGGFVGVDVFFVISGYLITLIILQEHNVGNFTMKDFWARRVRRIMPAVLVMLSGTLTASLLLSFPDTCSSLGLPGLSVLSMVANVAMWRLTGNYWGTKAESLALLHTWSLSLEEQFYVIYPVVILVFLKMQRNRNKLALAALCIGYLACICGTFKAPSAAFFLLPTRAWELGVGCYLALLGKPKRPSNALSMLGILSIILSVLLISGEVAFPGYVSIFPVLGTGLVLHYANGLSPRNLNVTALLSNRALVYIGKISYSLYLWHWPVIVLGREWQARHETSSLWYLWLIPILSVLSYTFIEQPARKSRKAVYYLVGAGFLVPLVLSLYILSKPLPGSPTHFNPACWGGDAYDVTPVPHVSAGSGEIRMAGIERVERGDISPDILRNGGFIKQYGSATPSVVVFGSSHALMWAPVIDGICKELATTVSFQAAKATPGYIPIPCGSEKAKYMSHEEASDFDHGRMQSLIKWKPKLLIISDVYIDEKRIQKYRVFLQSVKIPDMAILFIEQPPLLDIGDVNVPRYIAWKDGGLAGAESLVPIKGTDDGRLALQRLSEEMNNISILRTQDLFLKNGKGIARIGKDVLYIDDDHLSMAGAERARQRIKDAIIHHLALPGSE